MEATINNALEAMRHNNFFWFMDGSYMEEKKKKAEAKMRNFVALVAAIGNGEIREALRNLWTLKYNAAHAQTDFAGKYNAANFEEQEARLMSVITSAA